MMGFAGFVLNLPTSIAEIEVKFAVRAKVNSVNAMIVLCTRYTSKQVFLGIGLVVTIFVSENHHAITNGNDYLVAENTNAMG